MTKRWTATKGGGRDTIQPKKLASKRARQKRIRASFEAAKEAGLLTNLRTGKKGTLR